MLSFPSLDTRDRKGNFLLSNWLLQKGTRLLRIPLSLLRNSARLLRIPPSLLRNRTRLLRNLASY